MQPGQQFDHGQFRLICDHSIDAVAFLFAIRYSGTLFALFGRYSGTVYLLASSRYTLYHHAILQGGKQWPGWHV